MNSWVKNLSQKPHAEKVKLFWAVIIISAAVLVVLWAVTGRYSARPEKADTSLFDTLGKGFHDVKESFRKK